MTPDPVASRALFDRTLIARRLAARRGQETDFVTALIVADLAERLLTLSRRFERTVLLAPDAARLPTRFATGVGPVDFTPVSTLLDRPDPDAFPSLPFPDCDLIVSLIDIAVTDDVPGLLGHLRAHLRPDGLLLAGFPGGATLTELRAAWVEADSEIAGGAYARIAPFIDAREAGALLQRTGLALPVADVEAHTVRYAGPLALFRDLRRIGAANPLAERPRRPVTARHLAVADAAYRARAEDPDGRVRASLEVIWMSGWAPDESQQKPLRPGSATISLADALRRTDDG